MDLNHKINASYSRITFIILFSFVIFISYKIIDTFLISVLMGAIIAHTLKPIKEYRVFKNRNSLLSSSIIIFALILVIVIPIGFFASSLIQQAIQVEKYIALHGNFSISNLINTISSWHFVSYFLGDTVQFQDQINVWSSDLVKTISAMALKQAAEIPSLIMQTIFILISALVFLSDGEKLVSWLSGKIPLNSGIKKALVTSFNYSSKSAVWATLAASAAQAITILIAFLSLGVPAAVLAAGTTYIFAFIPFLGSAPVLIVGAIYLYAKGSFYKFAAMIVIGIIAGLIDNVVRAFILKGPHGLHPLVGLIAVFGGISYFGIFGVLIGPMVVALLISMCEVWPQVLGEK